MFKDVWPPPEVQPDKDLRLNWRWNVVKQYVDFDVV